VQLHGLRFTTLERNNATAKGTERFESKHQRKKEEHRNVDDKDGGVFGGGV